MGGEKCGNGPGTVRIVGATIRSGGHLMKFNDSLLAVVVGLSVAACSSSSRRCCVSACEPSRQFLVLQAKPVAHADEGTHVLLECRVVTVPGQGRIQALDEAGHAGVAAAPVWVSDRQADDLSFGPRARVVNAPSILAVDGQDATMFVGDHHDGPVRSGWHLAVTPTIVADRIHMTVAYRHHEAGRLVHAVPAMSIDGPPGRVFIIESR